MADDNEIRVVISGVAEGLRRAISDAKGDLGGLAAATKAMPKEFKITVDLADAEAKGKLGGLTAAIKAVPREVKVAVDLSDVQAGSKLSKLNLEVQRLQAQIKRNSEFGLSTRHSVAELALVERAIDRVTQAEARAALLSRFSGGDTGGPITSRLRSLLGGGQPDTQISGLFSAATGPAAGGAAAAGPLAGAAGPLAIGAGVAAAAGPLLGAGAIGVSGITTIGLGGLLPLLALVKPALADIQKVANAQRALQQAQELYGKNQAGITAAQNNYTAAVKAFGPGSAQALAAHDRLVLAQNAVANSAPQVTRAQRALNQSLVEYGGPARTAVLGLAAVLNQLDTAMTDAGAQIVPALSSALKPLIASFVDLLPTLVQMAKIDLKGIEIGLRPLIAMMRGAEFKGLLIQLAQLFAKLAPQIFAGLGQILLIFMRTAVAAGPAMLALSGAFTEVLTQIAKFTATKGFQQMVTEWTLSFIAWMKAIAPLIPALIQLFAAFTPLSTMIAQALTPVVKLLAGAMTGLAGVIHSLASTLGDVLLAPVHLAVAALGLLYDALSHLGDGLRALGSVWGTIWGGIKTAFSTVLDFVLGGLSTLIGAVKSVLDTANIDLPIIGHVFGDTGSRVSRSLGGAQRSIDDFRKTLRPTADTAKTEAGVMAAAYEASMTRIGKAMQAGTISVNKGLTEIAASLKKELAAVGVNFSAPALGLPGFSALTPGPPAGVTLKAGGGWVGRPGEKGRDEVDIRVGRGEAVLNHTQQHVANQFLAPIGGLPGLFSRTKGSLHHMAGGGFAGGGQVVTASEFGGHNDPSAYGHSTASGAIANDTLWGFAELSNPPSSLNFSALGHLPMGSALDVALGGRVAHRVPKVDVGAGGPGLNGHIRAIDLTYAVARAIGMGGLADVMISGGTLSGSSAGAAAFQKLLAPKWTGPGGALGAIGKGALDKYAAAATAYGQAHMPAPTSGAFGGSVVSGFGGHSGYVFPFPKGVPYSWQRVDHGQDLQETPGAPIVAIAPGSIYQGSDAFSGFGPYFPIESITSGPLSGRSVYYGHTKLSKTGPVQAGDVIGTTQSAANTWTAAPAGWLELGFLPFGGSTGGDGMAAVLHAIAAGKYAGGGFAGGGTIHKALAAAKNKVSKPAKAAKPLKLPKLKSPAGFDLGQLDQLTAMDKHASDLSGGWQSYINALHGGPSPAVSLVTLADGSQVVNLDGMKDPTSGQWDKGIKQRLKEIGPVGTKDITTELGIDNTLLDIYSTEQGIAGRISNDFGGWLALMTGGTQIENSEIGWLNHVLDPQWPLEGFGEPKWPKSEFADMVTAHGFGWSRSGPWQSGASWGGGQAWTKTESYAQWIKDYVASFKNALAQIKHLTRRKQELAAEKQARTFSITQRFNAEKSQLGIGKLTDKVNAGILLAHQHEALKDEEAGAMPGLNSAAPAGWVGSKQAWAAELQRERAAVTAEFADRRLALDDTAARSGLTGAVQRATALAALSAQEAAEKQALTVSYTHQSNDLTNLIAGKRSTSGGQKTYLSGLRTSINSELSSDTTNINNATQPGGFRDTLADYINPMGGLAINKLMMQNITIPAVLAEIASLTGTTAVPAPGDTTGAGAAGATTSTGPALTALNSLLTTQTSQLAQALALSQAQFSTLLGFEPLLQGRLIGSFATGINYVPQTGPALVHRGEMIIPDPDGPFSNRVGATVHGAGGDTHQIDLHFHGESGELVRLVDARINQKGLRIISDHSGQRARLIAGVRGR